MENKTTEWLDEAIKPMKKRAPTYEEYISEYLCKNRLLVDNLVKLLIEKNILTKDELDDKMRNDFETNLLPELKNAAEVYNKVCGLDKE